MHTRAGLVQENNAPDNAKETQSAGVPVEPKISMRRQNI